MFFHIKNNKNWAIVLFKEGGQRWMICFCFHQFVKDGFLLGMIKLAFHFSIQ